MTRAKVSSKRERVGSERHWSCTFENQTIDVEAGIGPGTKRRLLVNGIVVAEETAGKFRPAGYLCARARFADSTRVVEAAFGEPTLGGISCKIFVGRKLVGGDVDATFTVPDPIAWRAIRRRGRLRFVARKSLLVGIPVVSVAVLLALFGAWRPAIGALTGALLPAWSVANGAWEAAERQYRFRKRKLADPSFTPPPPISMRGVASLFLLALGIVLIALSSMAFVMGATFSTGGKGAGVRGADVALLVVVAIFGAGIASVMKARRLRRSLF